MTSEWRLPEMGDQIPRRSDPRMQRFGEWVFRSLGWTIVGEVPNQPRLVLIGAPHTSNKDGLVVMALVQMLQVHIAIMGKDKLFKIPLFGRWLRWLGLFPIDRSSPQGVVEQNAELIRQADQFWLGLAPEGTRKKAASWKNGFYRIAQMAGVPIVMVALDYAQREIRFSPVFQPSGDYEADLRQIQAFFADAEPCCPEMLSVPLAKLRAARLAARDGN